jgi:PspA-Associated protein
VIVRVATDDQYRLPDELVDQLNEIDGEAEKAAEAGDEAAFQELLARMIELVQTKGERLADDELVASDVILPPPHATIAEVGDAFDGEGLIPG